MEAEMLGQIIFYGFVCCHFIVVIIVAIDFDDDVDIAVTFTSFQESFWNRWGIPGIGYLQRGKNRPKLLYIKDSR